MRYKEYKGYLTADRERYAIGGHFKTYVCNSGYRIITHYRRCKLLEGRHFLFPLYQLQRFIYNRKCIKAGCDIPSHVVIGQGLKIDHTQGIVINSKVVIGKNCTIKSGVVIGKNNRGTPIIGNNVMIGVHALIIGNVNIASGTEIGAGAIVTHDTPANSVVICDSAHILRIKEGVNEEINMRDKFNAYRDR